MVANETRITRTATISGVEDAERLLRRGCRVMSTTRRTPQIETRVKQPVQESNNLDNEDVSNFHAVADRVMSEECTELLAATSATHLTSEQLLIRDALARIPDHVKEALTRIAIDSNAN